jgi:hypothetical protein
MSALLLSSRIIGNSQQAFDFLDTTGKTTIKK